MHRWRTPPLATSSTWLLTLALILLAVFAVDQSRRFQADMEREERDRIRAELQGSVESWHQGVTAQVLLWLFYLGHEPNPLPRETRLRRDYPYFDAFYLWDISTHEVLFPPMDLASERRPARSRCFARTEALGVIVPSGAAAQLYLACLPLPPLQEVLATTRAARLLLDDRKPERALKAIRRGQLPLGLPLGDSATLDVPMETLAARRLLAAECYDTLGRTESARRLLVELGSEIAALDGPQLIDALLESSPSVIDSLHSIGADTDAADLDSLFERAWRRQEAWLEVVDRVSQRSYPPPYDAMPQVVRDQYGQPPFMMLYREVNDQGQIGAIQLDERALMEAFLGQVRPELRNHLVIVDGTGRRIAGFGPITDDGILLPLPAPFGYLRLGIANAGRGFFSGGAGHHFTMQVAPIVVATLLGVLALLARIAADRRQQELAARQREFVTRVTHELKTPLAGIRVMAEAIEIGAFKNDPERIELALRIEQESERLAARVEEILRVAREPRDFHPEPISPTSLAQEVAERWRPLMEQAGVELNLDLQPTPTILVEVRILRDALAALLDNALKYRDPSPEKGSLVNFRVWAEGHRWVHFEVTDNGIGVPIPMRREVFQPFTRVEGPDRGTAGGHGLGLSFVANAARIHRGKADCREGIEGGTTFTLRIPQQPFSAPWLSRLLNRTGA